MWTETKTNDQFSSTGWMVNSSQIFCLRKDTCSKPKPRQNCIGQLDRARSAVTCNLSHQWRHSRRHWEILDEPPSICQTCTTCTLRKLQLTSGGGHEQSTDGGETSRWRNVQGAKRLVKGRNIQGAKRQRGETSINHFLYPICTQRPCRRNFT